MTIILIEKMQRLQQALMGSPLVEEGLEFHIHFLLK